MESNLTPSSKLELTLPIKKKARGRQFVSDGWLQRMMIVQLKTKKMEFLNWGQLYLVTNDNYTLNLLLQLLLSDLRGIKIKIKVSVHHHESSGVTPY